MKRFWKFLWKVLKGLGEIFPLFLAFGAAFYAGFYLEDKSSMHFFIVMGGLFLILRESYEARKYLKLMYEEGQVVVEERVNTDEFPLQISELREIRIILERLAEDDDNSGGRHSGASN